MGKTYRIRTTPGDDKNIITQIDQDFEQLEILSLKIRQEDVYDRMCADYGVIAGRVLANRGYGVPNVKVSVFIPLKSEDEDNPWLTAIYPYKTLEQRNEDGYTYNLLPYLPSYKGHVPTGTFPSRTDVLNDENIKYLYETYYKYTVTTNDSGDFMIFGVPVGSQTLVMNVDLSDIGQFSLFPQDLIRMGVANEGQFDGVRFKSSANFNELPQIIVINKTIEVVPFWGQPETCQIGITRTDFDLTSEANIDIQPTAVFMGSIMSTSEKAALKANGSAKKETGDLCRLITGPGEILAIRQTIFLDSDSLPVLERAQLPEGGKLIDANGTWLFDVPMNLDYIFTNEFGEQVLSDDPSVGIPTKGKYRFKMKWQQSKNLNEDYKVGYFLVPNIREFGLDCTGGVIDPNLIPEARPDYVDDQCWNEFQRSYAFSLNWTGYTAYPTYNAPLMSMSNPDINAAVNCEDRFYEFDYNKVYTVAGFVDNYKVEQANSSLLNTIVNVGNKEKFLGIKRIDDDTCEDTTNRYPVNDGVFRTPLMWVIFNFLLIIFGVIGLPLLIIYSVVAFAWPWLRVLLYALCLYWVGTNIIECAQGIISAAVPSVGFGATVWVAGVIYYGVMLLLWIAVLIAVTVLFLLLTDVEFSPLRFPMITYPDCDMCNCNEESGGSSSNTTPNSTARTNTLTQNWNVPGAYGDQLYEFFGNYFSNPSMNCDAGRNPRFNKDYDSICIEKLMMGNNTTRSSPKKPYIKEYGVPTTCRDVLDCANLFTDSLPFGERLNLFCLKAKYYNVGIENQGWNQISVRYEPSLNTNPSFFHTDNVLVMVFQPGTYRDFSAGTLMSFVSPSSSRDPNIKGGLKNSAGTRSITGVTNARTSVTIEYANPNNTIGNLTRSYLLDPNRTTGDTYMTYTYASDIEYFQVITGMTISQYRALTGGGGPAGSLPWTIFSQTRIKKYIRGDCQTAGGYMNYDCGCNGGGWGIGCSEDAPMYSSEKFVTNIDLVDQGSFIMILQRGVDPYSPLYPTSIGIGKLLGLANTNGLTINTKLRINYPVRNATSAGNELLPIHSNHSNNSSTTEGGQYLFYPSYFFNPDPNVFTGWTTNLHRFYSRLDSTANYSVDGFNIVNYTNPANLGSSKDIRAIQWGPGSGTNPGNRLYSSSNLIANKYGPNESLAGGSVMSLCFRDWCRVADNGWGWVCRCEYSGWDNCFQGCDDGGSINFSSIYDENISLTFPDGGGGTPSTPIRMVMRSDRLPSSETPIYFATGSTASAPIKNNTPLLNQSSQLTILGYQDGQTVRFGGSPGSYSYNEGSVYSGANQFTANVMQTFDCQGMVDLNCYTGDGLTFGVDRNCAGTDAVESGCYVFVREPLNGLFKPRGNNDLTNWAEYVLRFRFFYGLCQGVFSNVFINNWVNGNLFAFSFKVDTYYNSLNQVSRRVFPKDVIVLQEDVNNFYYRCTPTRYFNPLQGTFRFTGFENNRSDSGQGGNSANINYPTTILNLGPVNNLLQEIVLSPNYYGYNVDNLPQTTYSDLSDMMNFFSIIRLVNNSFWKNLFSNEILRQLFSRPGNRVDADFAQSAAINSQLGVIPMDSDYYSSNPPNSEIIAAGFGNNEIMMGIYFNTTNDDQQTRDFISPARIIRYNPVGPNFIYDYLNVKSQIVPHYKWDINVGNTIFGRQDNNWDTTAIRIQQNLRYQQMDRISSDYPSGGDVTNDYNLRGYLFAYNTGPRFVSSGPLQINGTYTITNFVAGDDFSNVAVVQSGIINQNGCVFIASATTPTSWSSGSVLYYDGDYLEGGVLTPNPALAGAPWYFYFGVKKGATSLNRFITKYIGEEFI